MKYRCYNPKDDNYKKYGARGITVSQEWLESFESFYRDMGSRPPGTSLERLDNNGPYCKENCVWADRVTQNNNKRIRHDARLVSWNGKTQPLSAWAKELHIAYGTLQRRLDRKWSVERAFTKGPYLAY
jgi:hypothetical protein